MRISVDRVWNLHTLDVKTYYLFFIFFILPLLRNISLSGHFWFIGTSWPNLRAHNFLFVWRSNFILVRLTWNGIYLEMQIIQKNKIRQLWLRWTLDIRIIFSITYYWFSTTNTLRIKTFIIQFIYTFLLSRSYK